jgi:hypothetical protein
MPPEAPAPITEPTKTPPAVPAGDPPPAVRPAEGSDPPAKPSRPEWLGKPFDGYWSDDKGVDAAKLTADFETLTTLRADAEARAKAVPQNLEDYKPEVPEGFKLPEGMKLEALKDSPLLQPAREFAKKHGLSTDAFKEMVALQAKGEVETFQHLAKRAGEERTLLGENANARVMAVTTKLNAKLGAELANTILPMMFTAKQVEAMEKLVAEPASPRLTTNGRENNPPPTITPEKWDQLSPADKIAMGRELDAKRAAR